MRASHHLFAGFIGPLMGLNLVHPANRHGAPAIASFYMGCNTTERHQHIMNHLAVEAEP